MYKLKILLIFVIFEVNATTLLPLPIAEQLKSSKGVIFGTYKSKLFKRIHGVVVTEATFSVSESIGLGPNEIINKNNYKIIYPGGVWNGEVHQTIGAPNFKIGEKVALILKETKLGITVKGQSLGKYSVLQKGPHVYLSSEAFPTHHLLGNIKIKNFKSELMQYYTQDIKKFGKVQITKNNKYIPKPRDININKKHGKYSGRMPASVKRSNLEEEESSPTLLWAGLLFAFFGIISTLFSRRSQRK